MAPTLKHDAMIRRDEMWHMHMVQASVYDDGDQMDAISASDSMKWLVAFRLAHDDAKMGSFRRKLYQCNIIMYTAAWPVADDTGFE